MLLQKTDSPCSTKLSMILETYGRKERTEKEKTY